MVLAYHFEWFQKEAIRDFFSEINPESLFQHQDEIKKPREKKISQKVIITAGGSKLVSQTKITYSDFLKKLVDLLFFVIN